MNIAALEPFLLELAAVAAAETLPRFRAPGTACDNKAASGFDPVTEADRAAEAAIRARIAAAHPGHGVIGEEYGEDRPDAEFVWVLDPIDGTRAFIAGAPVWTTLIGLRWRGRTVLGLIAQPVLGEIYIGGAGLGERCIDPRGVTPLATRTGVALGEAIAASTDPALFAGDERAAWDRLARTVRLARYGLDAYAMAQLAAGHIDLVVETGLKPWDACGPRAVIEGAGGVVEDWNGIPAEEGRLIFAGSPALATVARAMLAGQTPPA